MREMVQFILRLDIEGLDDTAQAVATKISQRMERKLQQAESLGLPDPGKLEPTEIRAIKSVLKVKIYMKWLALINSDDPIF